MARRCQQEPWRIIGVSDGGRGFENMKPGCRWPGESPSHAGVTAAVVSPTIRDMHREVQVVYERRVRAPAAFAAGECSL